MAILNNIGNLTKNLHHYVLLSTKINVVYYKNGGFDKAKKHLRTAAQRCEDERNMKKSVLVYFTDIDLQIFLLSVHGKKLLSGNR